MSFFKKEKISLYQEGVPYNTERLNEELGQFCSFL